MNFAKKNIRGILLSLATAVPAWFLGTLFPVIGGPVFAILLGIIAALFIKDKSRVQPGVSFVSKKILQSAIVFLGFSMNLREVAIMGRTSLPIIIATISTSLITAYIMYRILGVREKSAILVGVGSSICGGSAIAATAPVIGADDDEIAQSISVIFLFNIIAAVIFPALGSMLGLSNRGFSLFAGTAINDTSSVTAAASTWDSLHGSNTLNGAAIVKMTRTLAIIPITLVLSVIFAKRKETARQKNKYHKDLSSFRAVFRPRFADHDDRLSSCRHRVISQIPEQVLYCHGHGRHRIQYRYSQTRQDRREAHTARFRMLGRHRVRQPADAAYHGDMVGDLYMIYVSIAASIVSASMLPS